MLSAAKYLAATTVDLLTQPDLVVEIRDEFAMRTAKVKWESLLRGEVQPPLYQPPEWFLRRTDQSWPPAGMSWPPERFVSHGTYTANFVSNDVSVLLNNGRGTFAPAINYPAGTRHQLPRWWWPARHRGDRHRRRR